MSNRILYLQYTNPAAYPSLEHSSRILANDGWQVLFLGTGAFGADALRFPPHERITVKQMPFQPPGWRQKLHYLRFGLWALAWTLRWCPQWVYASDMLSTPVALLLSFLPGVRIIYHEHDSPIVDCGLWIADRGSRILDFMRFVLWTRRRLAQRAQLCVLPNERRARHFASSVTNGRPVITVWNCPSLEEVSPRRMVEDERVICLWYHGSLVPSRLPPTVLYALAMLPDAIKLRAVGYETVGHPGYARELCDLARALGIEARVEIQGPRSRQELLKECCRADIGLALMSRRNNDVNFRWMVGASNKPFDYLACGLALLVSDLPDWREMYVAPGYGLACNPDDPESIAAALRWFLEHPVERREMGERGRQRIVQEWNYERQFAPVWGRLNDKQNLW
ncbi:MAG: glycosyltransferase [Anaerolineales bacterium]|nr:glycosyltransferase [Anaerolineales bacterium]